MKLFLAHPLVTRVVAFFFVPAVIAGACLVWRLNASLPQVSGEVEMAGLSQPVEVVRDNNAVVRIKAASDQDVFFTMGYVHAQDRLWQMEVQRRMVRGRMSEVFGRSHLGFDGYIRTLGLYRAAGASWNYLGPEARQSLQSYADGVNAWLQENHPLPPEFTILGVEPHRWEPVDSLAWAKFFALTLGGNLAKEIERIRLKPLLSEDQYRSLYPLDSYVSPRVSTLGALDGISSLQAQLEPALQIGADGIGSNAWVVAGSRAASGRAMLANDPHLSLQTPSLWYAVAQKGSRLDVAGMSMVGLPVVIFGASKYISWGGTSMMADTQDAFIERIDPSKPDDYLSADGWKHLQVEEEAIAVKPDFPSGLRAGIKPVPIRIRRTEHGPLISDATGAFDQPVALRWTALDNDDTTYEAMLRISYATDWASFREAARLFVAPALNLLYADARGNIGFQGVGRIPLRSCGRGSLPTVGWQLGCGWNGHIPFAEMPTEFNPLRGYIVSANNNMLPQGYQHFISSDWAAPERAARIESLLKEEIARGPVALEAMKRIQGDLFSLDAKRILPLMLRQTPDDGEQRRALDLLSRWDLRMSMDSPAAAIYHAWSRHLREQLFESPLVRYWEPRRNGLSERPGFGRDVPAETVERALTDSKGVWCDVSRTVTARSCGALLKASFAAALKELSRLRGPDMERWGWGQMQTAVFQHTPFSDVKLLSRMFELRIHNGGAADTVNVAASRFDPSMGYVQGMGASFRLLVEMGDKQPNDILFVNSTGQSGHPFSGHYDDMLPLYRDGRYFRLSPQVSNAGSTILTLRPRQPDSLSKTSGSSH